MAGMTYAASGVDYAALDPFKRAAQKAARTTAINISVLYESYGQSAFLIEQAVRNRCVFAHVEEGLGTKNVVADIMQRITGKIYYDAIAQDTVAMIVNDLITLAALPLSVAMHLAVGDSRWFDDAARAQALIEGWRVACNLARCAWGGGETPTLKSIVNPEHCLLSGSAMGVISPSCRQFRSENIDQGDAIMLVGSSGIHANGLTMARAIGETLPNGYLTTLPSGRAYGETLLDPTHIYVRLIEACLDTAINIHYAINITGHGWRKLMRANEPWSYVIDHLPPQLEIFDFIQEQGKVGDIEMYGNYNMGAGFALFVPPTTMDMEALKKLTDSLGFSLTHAGHVEKSSEKKVIIRPKNLTFSSSSLAVR
jgi:phosphoribosylformylglycinamidine cyclo-ligase